MTDDGTRTWLDDVLDRAKVERDKLTVRRAKLAAEVGRVDADIRRIDRMVRAAEAPAPKAKAKKQATSGPSPQRLLRTAEAIMALGGEFTSHDLDRAMGYSSVGGSAEALRALREMEFVGKARAEKRGNGPTPTTIYRVLDTHLIDDLRERVNGTD